MKMSPMDSCNKTSSTSSSLSSNNNINSAGSSTSVKGSSSSLDTTAAQLANGDHHHRNCSSSSVVICRDYLRNVCTRGSRCKFNHNKNSTASGSPASSVPSYGSPVSGSSYTASSLPGPGSSFTASSSPESSSPAYSTSACSSLASSSLAFSSMATSYTPSSSSSDNMTTSSSSAASSVDSNKEMIQDTLVFCHDYQNNKGNCPRSNCRFIHCSKSEEDQYRKCGYLPPLLRDQVIRKGIAPDLPAIYGFKPVCKDYLKGECRRKICKFRHLSPMQYDIEISKYTTLEKYDNNKMSCGGMDEEFFHIDGKSVPNVVALNDNNNNNNKRNWRRKISGGNVSASTSCNENKRLKVDFYTSNSGGNRAITTTTMSSSSAASNSSNATQQRMMDMLQRDNLYLKARVDDLKKQVDELSTTNDFLLNQNAQLRLGAVVKTSQATSIVSDHTQGQTPGVQAVSVQGISSMGPAVASITCMDGSVRIPGGSTVSLGPPPPPPPPPPVSLNQCQSIAPATGPIVNPAQSATLPPPTVTVAPLQLPPTVSLAPNTALVQETRLVSYPITSILPPMQ